MQNSSKDFLFSEIKKIKPQLKKLALLEEYIGHKVVDLLFYKPTRLLHAKICNELTDINETEDVIIEIKIIKHYANYFNRRVPYKILGSFKDKKVSLIFFAKHTGYLKKIFPVNANILIKGKIDLYKNDYQITHPEIIKRELLDDNKDFYKVIYKQKKILKTEIIQEAISKLCNFLPELKEWNKKIFKFYKNLPSFKDSIINIHNPKTNNVLMPSSPYIIRLAYDEMLSYQLSLAILRNNLDNLTSNVFDVDYISMFNDIKKLLPFELTSDQKNSIKEIIEDLKSKKRTLRLLQGDVGSGKTAVAMITAYFVMLCGFQVAILAPTELLARQHHVFISNILKDRKIQVDLLLASSKNKTQIKKNLSKGKIDLIIGTHSLLQDDVKFNNLSFVIIDEQHRFGVSQRIKIRNKGKKVDMLLLTATPIPRTMMLTILGDIEISTIKNKPYNSKIETILKSEENIPQVVNFIKKKLSLGEKVFWVCPKIDDEDLVNNSNVEKRFLYLKKIFKESAILHGKMSSDDKIETLNNFRLGKIKLLVSTVVIEVGIDVPNANIMVIDSASSFGLAQAHQLRGRVGRGKEKGVCILLYKKNLSELALKRLSTLKYSQNGFEIAEKDLSLRGGGELMGTNQYGSEEFIFFDFKSHLKLAELAIDEAKSIIKDDPKLQNERAKELLNLLKIFKNNDATNLLTAG